MRVTFPETHPVRQPRSESARWSISAGSPVDLHYPSLFRAVPTPCVVLDADLMVRDCNDAYVEVSGRTRAEVIGTNLFAALPTATAGTEPVVDTVRRAVLSALETGRTVVVGLQRYEIDAERSAGADEGRHYWIGTAVPVSRPGGAGTDVLYNIHDVTALVPHLGAALSGSLELGGVQARAAVLAATAVAEQSQMFDLALETQRQLGIAVQEVMLPAEVPASVTRAVQVAVRYRPASDALQVGGDWYDVADLGQGRLAVAVGDVVGHGLRAAAVMGQLRSALSALTVADVGPAAAMTALDKVARHSPDATATTAVKVVIDPELDLAIYSNAGHLPPLVLREDGTVHALDQALGPPLAVTQHIVSRPLGTATLAKGDTLVMYTDGLVERRGESLDRGIRRLAAALVRLRELDVETMADTLLAELPPDSALRDDIALIVLRL